MLLNIERQQSNLLEQIAHEIGQYCRRYGRIQVTQTKEKYGSVRVYCGFGSYGLHGLIYPGYAYSQFPKWLWNLDCTYGNYITRYFDTIIVPWQKFIYRRAYWKQIKKYPHLFDEITGSMDWDDVLGFEKFNLCSEHSQDYNKSCYLVHIDKCDECLFIKKEENK